MFFVFLNKKYPYKPIRLKTLTCTTNVSHFEAEFPLYFDKIIWMIRSSKYILGINRVRRNRDRVRNYRGSMEQL